MIALKDIPEEWYTEKASTCFSRSFNGEGSYYCPECDTNCGSVWRNEDWRPTKLDALCAQCQKKFNELPEQKP